MYKTLLPTSRCDVLCVFIMNNIIITYYGLLLEETFNYGYKPLYNYEITVVS